MSNRAAIFYDRSLTKEFQNLKLLEANEVLKLEEEIEFLREQVESFRQLLHQQNQALREIEQELIDTKHELMLTNCEFALYGSKVTVSKAHKRDENLFSRQL